MTIPGEQNPHCEAPEAVNALAQVARLVGGRPSRVSTDRPSTRPAGWAHETTARPSTMTVHAPHDPSGAQPSFIERRPQSWRNTSRRLASGREWMSTLRPFRMNRIDTTFVPSGPGRLALPVGISPARM